MKVELIYGHEALLPSEIPDGPCVACRVLDDEQVTMCARCARPLHFTCGIALQQARWDALVESEHYQETGEFEGFVFLCLGCLS